jgi:MFS family permease
MVQLLDSGRVGVLQPPWWTEPPDPVSGALPMTDAATLSRMFFRYQATASLVFFQPIFVVYYLDAVGLDLATVLGLQSYNVALRALLEVPSGVLADRWSRRGCLAASALLTAAGAALLVIVPAFAAAVFAETVFGAAHALRSGADSALLHDGLEAAGAPERYPAAESRARAIGAVAAAATALAGGVLAEVGLAWPYVATVGASLVGIMFAMRLPEPAHDASAGPARLRPALAVAARHAGVRWTIGLAMLAVVASHVYFYFQQPYLRAIGVPLWAFGAVFATTKLITAVVAVRAHRIDRRLGMRGAVATMTAIPVMGIGAMALVSSPAGVLLVLTRGLLDGLWEPLVNVYLNRLVPTRLRATLLSLQNLAARLALAAAIAVLGWLAGTVGLPVTLAVAAATTLLAGVALTVAAGVPQRGERLAGTPPCDS